MSLRKFDRKLTSTSNTFREADVIPFEDQYPKWKNRLQRSAGIIDIN